MREVAPGHIAACHLRPGRVVEAGADGVAPEPAVPQAALT